MRVSVSKSARLQGAQSAQKCSPQATALPQPHHDLNLTITQQRGSTRIYDALREEEEGSGVQMPLVGSQIAPTCHSRSTSVSRKCSTMP